MSDIDIAPSESGVGAEVLGINLARPLSEELLERIHDAFEEYRLLVFRDLYWTVKQQVAFSEHFGKLEDFPDPKDQADGYKTVLRVTNIDRATNTIKSVDDPGHKSFTLGTSAWHIDSSFRTVPSKASILYAIEMPDEGGDTMFADTTLAYDSLSEERKSALEHLVIIHDFEETRRRHNLPPRPPEVQAITPPVRQPLVAERPNGRRALFIGSHAAGIEGMPIENARGLIDELEKICNQPDYTYRHKWQVGDMVMFDNICVMHQAMPYDLVNSRRLLHRTTVAGDMPLSKVGGVSLV
ncbi:MAG: Alpha-ketoglutarate-dependent 2,4-dichlorophenoxyacetate dioxygenase [Alphaproteobacteria bacterium MarineAlpha11_Bin1]|nr:MAG: Alpha-ketoglutarate-dependent 2,4-dichlorophenoxyacetate dioxygenase [Alphaproteobacteria bacterium MarineAlpha11_Bin1]|tara:strand:+ start:2287 stop:3177 length:891 start_codon:yes stop_codon:yes gene_type:complete